MGFEGLFLILLSVGSSSNKGGINDDGGLLISGNRGLLLFSFLDFLRVPGNLLPPSWDHCRVVPTCGVVLLLVLDHLLDLGDGRVIGDGGPS